tara:strand:+ start:43 stop:591 length:549 start_codon:yes stop_codon:yes gene_type:complete
MKGSLANTKASKKLDSMMKKARAQLKEEFSGVFEVRVKLYFNAWVKYFLLKPKKIGCEPDGGLWYLKGILVAVFEGKHQGPRGNADERWWKNISVVNHIFKYYKNLKGIYYTFSTGLACKGKWLDNAELSSIIFPADVRWNLKQESFTYEEILEGMRNTLNEILKKNHIPHVYPVKRGKFND